ncbi:MAG: RNA polymerase subunit sigma-70 [Bacteroidetes bacterium]|nr:MAG: RNA polymerase subunit sigma-70 [Bacteroidota bacterium]
MAPQEFNQEFSDFIEAHKKIIFKVCNSYCSNPEDRKDLAQEIVFQIWKSFEKYNDKYKISTWIYRIALNVAISFYRHKKRRLENFTPINDSILEYAAPDENGNQLQLKTLHESIEKLDPLNRALMILYLDDNSYKEISEILGISESNVATKLNRIKQKLKQQLQKA